MSDKKKTLAADDIVATSQIGRRGALGIVGATLVGAAATAVVGVGAPGKAHATTDNDTGPGADQAGRGRSGQTDSDSGPNADTGGHGRGGGRGSQTDSDSGPNADRSGQGRGNGRSGSQTDSDSGPNADTAGHGRRRR